MKKLFWGFFFIYLNFHLNFNQYSLNVLPDFVGYILIVQAARELEVESHLFQGVRPFAAGMAIYTAILWVGALFGVTGDGWLSQILGLADMAVSLYIAWVLIQAVRDVEQRRVADLNGDALYGRWKAQAIVQVLSTLLGWMMNLANLAVVSVLVTVLVVAGLVIMIGFLVAWWNCAKAYEALPVNQPAGDWNPER